MSRHLTPPSLPFPATQFLYTNHTAPRNCPLLQRHFRDVTLPPTDTEITLSRMAAALTAILEARLCSPSKNKLGRLYYAFIWIIKF